MYSINLYFQIVHEICIKSEMIQDHTQISYTAAKPQQNQNFASNIHHVVVLELCLLGAIRGIHITTYRDSYTFIVGYKFPMSSSPCTQSDTSYKFANK